MAPRGRPRKHLCNKCNKNFPLGNALRVHMAHHWRNIKQRKDIASSSAIAVDLHASLPSPSDEKPMLPLSGTQCQLHSKVFSNCKSPREHMRKHREKVVTKPVEEAAGLMGALDIVDCDYNVMLSPPVKRKRSKRETPAVNLNEMDVAAALLLLSEHSDRTSASEDCYGGDKDGNISASNGLKDVKLDASDHLLVRSDELKKPKNDKSSAYDDCYGQCKKDNTLIPTAPKDSAYEGCSGQCEKDTNLIPNDPKKDKTLVPNVPKDNYSTSNVPKEVELGVFYHKLASDAELSKPRTCNSVEQMEGLDLSAAVKANSHQCNACGRSFLSGQTLGGHMRCDCPGSGSPREHMRKHSEKVMTKPAEEGSGLMGALASVDCDYNVISSPPVKRKRSKRDTPAVNLDEIDAAAALPLPSEHSDKTPASEDCYGGDKDGNILASNVLPLKSSWEKMPMDLAGRVLGMIWTLRDRVRMSSVNRHWNEALKQNSNLLRHWMPSLLLPCTARTLVHDTLRETTYELRLPEDIRQRGRICGSSEGGWIVLALEHPCQNILFNINTSERLPLPNTIFVKEQVSDVKLLAAALSTSPSADLDYVVGAILFRNGIHGMALCGHGSAHWLSVVCPRDKRRSLNILDVIYYRGCFYYLTCDLNLHVLRPGQANLHTIVRVDTEWINIKDYQLTRRQYYLLQAGQDLYQVVKHGNYDERTTTHFHIFMLEQWEEPFWTHQPQGLAGRSVFVGRASSRAVQTPGSHPFSGRIQFHDDRELQVPRLPNLFQTTDMGSYSFADSEVHPWPPAGGEVIPPRSDRTPPGWWIH